MPEVKVKTDNKWRLLKAGYELPKKQRKEFDYLTDAQYDDVRFAYYNKRYYDIQEFMRFDGGSFRNQFSKWDGYHSDSYFSGVLIKLSNDGERYKIGRYTS